MAKLFSNQRLKAVGRLLNDEEMEQVFGGYGIADEGLDQFLGAYGQPADDDDDDDDDIVVTGDPGEEDDDDNDDIVVTGDPGEDEYDGEGGDGAGGDEDYGDDDDDSEDGSGDGSSSPEDAYPQAALTPCVETSFAGSTVSTERVNNAALAASNEIKGLSQGQEWGAFIYELGGQVLYTTPFTNGSDRRVTFNTGILPDGAHVLGIIHSHPDESGVDDRTPSDVDWDDVYDNLAGQSGGGVSVDANLLMYIYTDQDGKTRVYDNTDDGSISRERVTCPLEG